MGRFWFSGRIHFCQLSSQNGYIHNQRLLDDNNIECLHFLYVLKFKLDIVKRTTPHKHLKALHSYMTRYDANIYISGIKLFIRKRLKMGHLDNRQCVIYAGFTYFSKWLVFKMAQTLY